MASRPVTVGTAATPLLSYNPRRTSVAIFNEDGSAIFIGEDQSSLLTRGAPIQAGGFLALNRALGATPDRQMFGISAAGGADIRILEQFGQLPPLETPSARLGEPTGEGA